MILFLAEKLVNAFIRLITGVVCKIDASQLGQISNEGPLILAINHINFLEAPIFYTRLQPRPVTGFAKTESWDSWWMGKLFDLWGIIPIKRFSADSRAIRRGLAALKDGFFLAVAPEGTRSGNGVMRQAHPGIVLMALHSGAPIQPVAVYGSENFWENLKSLRRTEFNIRVGRPFYLDVNGEKPDRTIRTRILDEIMYQIADLLPEQYRGVYADMSSASADYLEFIPETLG